MTDDDFAAALGTLGYIGFGYLRNRVDVNPTDVLMHAMASKSFDIRLVEGLPWLLANHDMDWDVVIRNVLALERQNQLAFLICLAVEVATIKGDADRVKKLSGPLGLLEACRLDRESTLFDDSMYEVEREWLRLNRPAAAAHWNVLSSLQIAHMEHATL